MIITVDDDHAYPAPIPSEDQPTHEIGVGSRVRVIREPYFGISGFVEEVPTQPHTFESGVTTDIYVIRLDGQRVAVARANVEPMVE
jgi:transcription antitermination factor NusG